MTNLVYSLIDLLSSTAGMLMAALLLDRLIGEPKNGHPLIWFGRWVDFCRQVFQPSIGESSYVQRKAGVVAWLCAVVPCVMLFFIVSELLPEWLRVLFSILVLYFTIGWQSLREHALAIAEPLVRHDLSQARVAVSKIVSRDTQALTESDITKAGIESVLENGSDAIFAPIFWFLVFGVPGALCYRLVNTLDAMWGYKTESLLYFGWFAARFDDVMNFIPARLVVLTYGVCGYFQGAWRCYRRQSGTWKSPNAGPVMAAGAGALGVQLGGEAPYFGKIEVRPILGEGPMPVARDLNRAILLVDKSVYLWGLIICLLG